MSDALARETAPIRSRTFAALDNPDYRRYYLGQGVSLVGTWLQVAAVKWIVFDKTQSEFMLGVVEAAGLMPGLLVGLVAGVLADRVVPRRMILAMQVGQMILAFALAAADRARGRADLADGADPGTHQVPSWSVPCPAATTRLSGPDRMARAGPLLWPPVAPGRRPASPTVRADRAAPLPRGRLPHHAGPG